MIAASLMGLVMLCYNLLYRPWLASSLFTKREKRTFPIENYFDKLKKTIHKVGSLVYFLIIDNFIFNIEEMECPHPKFQKLMQKCGI